MPSPLVQSGLAFVEGMALVFSPCILPVLPLILAGGATGDRRKPFGIITGFVLSFTAFALASRQVFAVSGIAQDTIQTWSYALIVLMGVIMLVPRLEEGFARLTQGIASRAQALGSGKRQDGFAGGLFLGALIGLVWTPCAGGIIAVVLVQVIQSQTDVAAVATIFMFSLGVAVPMLAIALTGKALAQKFGRYTTAIRHAMGAVLVIFGGFGLLGVNVGTIAARFIPSLAPAVTAKAGELQNALPAPYKAPEIAGITQWINGKPDLKGKVVLVDFWTYSCINCLRTLPYLRTWYAEYHDKGFEIVGVHAPEFAFEGNPENVEAAVKKYGVAYPVAMDNHFTTWKNFKNEYWPAHYLIDKNGRVVYTHFGEGHYEITEHNIRALLGLDAASASVPAETVTSSDQTPETYLGTARAAHESTEKSPPLHHWRLDGKWERAGQYITATAAGDTLTLHFSAKKVFLVMSSKDKTPVRASVTVDQPGNAAADVKNGQVIVSESRLYELVNFSENKKGVLRISAKEQGVQAYAFTFEGGIK